MSSRPAPILRVDGEQVALTIHAVHRYIERAKPALSHGQAIRDIQTLAACCGQIAGPPVWANGGHPQLETDSLSATERWVHLGSDVAFALDVDEQGGLVTVTCISRGGISDEAAARRRAQRRRRPVSEGRRGRLERRPVGGRAAAVRAMLREAAEWT